MQRISSITCPACRDRVHARSEMHGPFDVLTIDEHAQPMRHEGDDPDDPCPASCLDVATAGANALRYDIEHFNSLMMGTELHSKLPYWRIGLYTKVDRSQLVIYRHRDPAFVASGDRDELLLATEDPMQARHFLDGMLMIVDPQYALRWQGKR